jgi:hypothetical protein
MRESNIYKKPAQLKSHFAGDIQIDDSEPMTYLC